MRSQPRSRVFGCGIEQEEALEKGEVHPMPSAAGAIVMGFWGPHCLALFALLHIDPAPEQNNFSLFNGP